MSENVPDKKRNEIMEEILSNPSNRVCFDCGSKDPKWASPYLGMLVCYECAARHRGYGAHISFIRSIDLDKWTRKQLKSLEITGNDYTRERFNELGVPKIGNIYDYQNDLVLKYRNELADKVKDLLTPETYREGEVKTESKPKEEKKEEKIEEKVEQIKIEEEKPEPEKIKEPTKFEIKQSAKVNVIKSEGKAGKKTKIKKVDFDFDFDSFNDVNFSEFTNKKNGDEDNFDNEEPQKTNNELEEEEQKKEGKIQTQQYNIKISKDEMNKKFANKKAISSEDYAALESNGSENLYYSNKIRSMGNSQAISSSDIYGTQDDAYEGESFGSKMANFAVNFTLAAAEKAKEIKNKTNDMLNKMQNKLGGGNY